MDRRFFVIMVGGGLLTTPLVGPGQAAERSYRIGVLSPFSSSIGAGPSFEAFRQTLRALGYVEGRNIALEYRWADGRYDQLPRLAAELVRLRVDVIFSAWSTPAALATKQATSTKPVVFAGVGDAVGVGLVASLARPGGNVTGVTFITEETIGKQLELLKDVIPGLGRVGAVVNPANPVYVPVLKRSEVTSPLTFRSFARRSASVATSKAAIPASSTAMPTGTTTACRRSREIWSVSTSMSS